MPNDTSERPSIEQAEIWVCPIHYEEFHVSRGGTCPACSEQMVRLVPVHAVVERLRQNAGMALTREAAYFNRGLAGLIEREFGGEVVEEPDGR